MILVDTNIILRTLRREHPHHAPAINAMKALSFREQEQFAIAPQRIYEAYVVMTRPAAVGGFASTSAEAMQSISTIRSVFTLLSEAAEIYDIWHDLVRRYNVIGKEHMMSTSSP